MKVNPVAWTAVMLNNSCFDIVVNRISTNSSIACMLIARFVQSRKSNWKIMKRRLTSRTA